MVTLGNSSTREKLNWLEKFCMKKYNSYRGMNGLGLGLGLGLGQFLG